MEKADRPSERRRDARVQGRIEVRFREAAEAARALRAYSLNLSAGGICIKTQREYEVGTALHLTLSLQGDALELTGMVAWRRDGAIGVRFTHVSPGAAETLEMLKQSLRRP